MESTATSKLVQTALALLHAYNSWDTERILAIRSTDCIQHIYPETLNHPSYNNDQYREHLSAIGSVVQNYHIAPIDVVEDRLGNKVAIYARGTGTTPVGPYECEYAIFLKMTQDHEKVCEIKEYIDSAYYKDFMQKVSMHRAAES